MRCGDKNKFPKLSKCHYIKSGNQTSMVNTRILGSLAEKNTLLELLHWTIAEDIFSGTDSQVLGLQIYQKRPVYMQNSGNTPKCETKILLGKLQRHLCQCTTRSTMGDFVRGVL